MTVIIAFVVGYVLGLKTDDDDVGQLRRSLRALYGSDEFSDVVTAARIQMASTLRVIADMTDGDPGQENEDGDLVATVRNLVGPN